MIRERIEEIMSEKGVSKAEFARQLGIKPQNVNTLLDTDNLKKLKRIAEVIGCEAADFLKDETKEPRQIINGYIEYNGVVYTIKSMEDLHNLQSIVNQNQQ